MLGLPILLATGLMGREPYSGPTGVPAPEPAPVSAPKPVDEVPAESAAPSAPDAGPPADPARKEPGSHPRPWTVGGFVDVSYAFNSNRPDNHLYRGTNTTPRTGEITIPAAGAYILREPDRIPVRFELGVHFGAAVDTLYAPEPVPGGAGGRAAGAEVWKHLALANVGGRIDASGTEIGAGLFPGPMGIGGFWSKDNWNYTPSWESNAAPFYVAGARIRQDVKVGFVEAWVVNGWQMLADSNAAPSYIVGTSLGNGALSLGQWVYFGPEHTDLAGEAFRVHSDTLLAYDTPRFGIAAVWDFGQERRTDLLGDPQHLWTGGALFMRGRALDRDHIDLDLAVRPDAWWDRDGVMFGADQWLVSGTGTATLNVYDHLQVRVEYRFDASTADGGYFYRGAAVTDDDPDLAGTQHTVFVALVGYFEHVFGLRADRDDAGGR